MKKIVYILLTVFFLILIYKLIDLNAALALISGANIYFISLALIIGIVNSYLIALRLKTIFTIFKEIPTSYFMALEYFGSFVSILLPFSMGGVSMALILSRKFKLSYLKSFLIILSDFLIGVPPIVFASVFAMFYFYEKKLVSLEGLTYPHLYLVFIASILVIIVIFFIRSKRKIMHKLAVFFVSSKTVFLKAMLLSFLIWFISNLQFYIFFVSFGIKTAIIDFVLANSILGLLSLIPGAPGKIGQYETFGILTLPYLINVDKNAVFAVLLFIRLLSSLVYIILGYASILYLNIDTKKIFKN